MIIHSVVSSNHVSFIHYDRLHEFEHHTLKDCDIYEIVTILQWVQTLSLSLYWFLVRKKRSKNCQLDHVLLLLLVFFFWKSALFQCVHFLFIFICFSVCVYGVLIMTELVYIWLTCSLLHYICITYATRSNTLWREFAITVCGEVHVTLTATAQWSS